MMTPDRLLEIKARLVIAREERRHHPRVTFCVSDMDMMEELIAEVERLRRLNEPKPPPVAR